MSMTHDLISDFKQSNASVLITGHTGFKGSWMTLLLESLGLEVFGYSLEANDKSLFQTLNRTGKIHEKFSDIRDYDKLYNFVKLVKPDCIIHLAAQSLVLDSYEKPKETFDVNVMGSVNVMEVARNIESVKIVGVVTSDKVYKNIESGRRFVETDQLEGKDPYSASKVATEAVITSWNSLNSSINEKKIVSLRAGNVIGGGDFAKNRLLPDIVRAFEQGKTLKIRNSSSTRPWQHVADPLFGYLAAIQYSLNHDDVKAFNFGPAEKSLTVGEVINISSTILDVEFEFDNQEKNMKIESKLLDLDSSLAVEKLGWSSTWSQVEATVSTLNWWRKLLVEKMDPLGLCLEDIELRLTR